VVEQTKPHTANISNYEQRSRVRRDSCHGSYSS